MTRGRKSVLSLAAALCCATVAATSFARSPVVDPYYQARQAALEQRQPPAQYEQDGEPASYQSMAGESDERIVGEPADFESSGPIETEAVVEGAEVAPEYIDQGMEYADDPNACGGGRPYAGCGPGYGCDPNSPQLSGYGDCYLDGACAGQQPVGPPSALWQQVNSKFRVWANLNYLSFWLKGASLPPLVTSSPLGTTQTSAGVLGLPTTDILFGGDRVNGNQRQGARIQAGMWLTDGEFLGIDGHYYALATATTRFDAASNFSLDPNAQILARPFFNTAISMQDSLVVAFPNFSIGGIPVNLNGQVSATTSSNVQSASAGLRHLLFINFERDHRLFLIGGYRFFRLDEDLAISDVIRPDGGPFLPGTYFATFDKFATQTQFHGGYVGLISDLRRGRFSLETQAQLAMGNVHELIRVNGSQSTFDGISTTTVPIGLLAKPTNSGTRSRDQFGMIPEIETKLGYQITPRVRITAGYNFTYVTRVVRPGNVVDLVVNPNQSTTAVNGVARPAPLFNATNLWIQGVTTGVEVRF